MGAKSSIKAIMPFAAQVTVAKSLGRDPVTMLNETPAQIIDAVNGLKVIVADMTAANPSDPNIATINSAITALI
jgi:hypothetical protein